MSRAVPGQPGW